MGSKYLLVAGDSLADALQLGVTDVMELIMGHGDNATTHGHEPPTVLHKDVVICSKGLKDLWERRQLLSMPGYLGGRVSLPVGTLLAPHHPKRLYGDTPILKKGKVRLKG